LVVLVVIASVGAWLLGRVFLSEKSAADETIVLNLLLWGVIAFVIAGLNKALGLGMLSKIAERVVFVMVPPLFLIFLVLGTIFIGVATPTEGGAMGAVG